MFQPLVISTLFHVHHQKDIKQDAEFKIRSQSPGKMCVHVAYTASLCVCAVDVYVYFFRDLAETFLETGINIMFTESASTKVLL